METEHHINHKIVNRDLVWKKKHKQWETNIE